MTRSALAASVIAAALLVAHSTVVSAEETASQAAEVIQDAGSGADKAADAAAQARREAGAVSPESLAAAKQAARDAESNKVRNGGASAKFGSLEGLDDDELVCRVENKTGSRLKKQACYRVADIRAYRKRLEEMGDLPGQGRQSKQTDGRTNVLF